MNLLGLDLAALRRRIADIALGDDQELWHIAKLASEQIGESDLPFHIAVDFDGVLTKGPWVGTAWIPAPALPGAIRWLNSLIETDGVRVTIFSCRCHCPEGIQAVQRWLLVHGCRRIEALQYTAKKPFANVYIDDAGWRFEGRFPSLEELRALRPWTAGESA